MDAILMVLRKSAHSTIIVLPQTRGAAIRTSYMIKNYEEAISPHPPRQQEHLLLR